MRPGPNVVASELMLENFDSWKIAEGMTTTGSVFFKIAVREEAMCGNEVCWLVD